MKKRLLSFVLAAVMLFASVFTLGAGVAANGTDGARLLAELKPSAITEDISGIKGNEVAVAISGSSGITSLAAHANKSATQVKVSLNEQGGEKFIRFTNKGSYTYSQLYINLDPAVFTAGADYSFSLTFRLSEGYTCTDGSGRAVLARFVDNDQNNLTVVSGEDLASGDYTDWTTVNFTITTDGAPKVLRLIIFAEPGDYIDIKSLSVYDAVFGREVTASGTVGELSWTLYSDGELAFTGKGAMSEFASASDRPWHSYASSIKTVNVGAGVSFIDDLSFYQCSALTGFKVDPASTYYRAVNGVLFNKDKTLLHTYPASNTQTSYTIPEGVTDVGGCAFYGAKNLTEIKLPSTLLTIGEKAFANCTKITEIDLPEGLRVLFGYAFFGCSSLASVDIPRSVALIGGQAFRGCSALTKAVVNGPYAILTGNLIFGGASASLKLHGYTGSTAETYANAYSHTFVSLGEIPENEPLAVIASGKCGESLSWTLYTTGELLISGSGKMTNWNSAEDVPWHIYRSYIKTAVIENGVTSIGECSFNETPALTSVEIPASVTSIEVGPFFNCDSLVSINVAEESTSFCDVDGILFSKDKSTLLRYPSAKAGSSYTVPSEVKAIGLNAFLTAPLSSVELPEGLLTLMTYAFQNCDNLTSIEIPASVESIGEGAFRLSSNLVSVKVNNPTAVFGETVFEYVADDFELRGYAGSTAEAYAKANGHTFVEIEDDIVLGDADGDGTVTKEDAIYVLMHTFFVTLYPENQDFDFDRDGYVTKNDAIYVLLYTFYPETYPIPKPDDGPVADGVVYVSDNGKDYNGGGSAANPKATLDAAYEAVKDGGTIVICGPLTLSRSLSETHYHAPETAGDITVTSVYGGTDYRETAGATVHFDSFWLLNSEHVFDGLHITVENSDMLLCCNGNKTVIGEDVVCVLGEAGNYVGITAGTNGEAQDAEHGGDLTVNGGTWQMIRGGARNNGTTNITNEGSINVVINGGEFYNLVFGGGDGTSVSGDVNVTINGGTFYYGIALINKANVLGNATLNITGGDFVYLTTGVINAFSGAGTLAGELNVNISGGDFEYSLIINGTKDGNAAQQGSTLDFSDWKAPYKSIMEHASGFDTVIQSEYPVLPEPDFSESEKLCPVYENEGEHGCLLESANFGSWENYFKYYDAESGETMNYRLYLPPTYDPSKEYPMVVYLHGAGRDASHPISIITINSLLAQSVRYSEKDVICVIPQCIENCDWPIQTYTVDVLFNLIEELQKHLSVDVSRRYIAGNSYGAMGTLQALIAHPNYFAAATVVGGAHSSYSSAALANIATTPMRMFCGENDEYGFYNRLEPLYEALKALNADVEYTVWPGKPHAVFSYTADKSDVVRWMLEQRLD